ncbi:hypothetical protein [Melghirimyces profundicolus]|uniref:hypothetical protein n=1 Tax=Melghirimyces profundicolus TaxID=1242148 RepID=UPI001FE74E46|nr:hypothetical protein [Melghirimyces profundicolus]
MEGNSLSPAGNRLMDWNHPILRWVRERGASISGLTGTPDLRKEAYIPSLPGSLWRPR